MTQPVETGQPARTRPPKRVSMRRNWVMLITTTVLVSAAFAATFVWDIRPQLGLDLQGGQSIRLGAVGEFDPESLDTAVTIISRRVNALGVAEAEVKREGNDIVVDLPGVKNRDQAERIVGRTAELRFRPVIAQLPLETVATPATTVPTSAPPEASGKARPAQTPPAPETTPTTAAAAEPAIPPAEATALIQSCDPAKVVPVATRLPSTSEADDVADQCVVLPVRNTDDPKAGPQYRLFLGRAALTGSDVDDAKASYSQTDGGFQWTVDMQLTGEGTDKFNKLAAESYPKQSPQNQVAITLDGEVLQSPRFNEPNFATGEVQITGGFTESDARDSAQLIRYGALPVKLKTLTSVSISPTLGQDQLRAGIIAGIIGLGLVMLYMLVFYRILGLVVWFGLAVTGMLIWTVISVLGETQGLALTIAGVCGLIVSVGVTVDSYVVYYERLKDEMRSGRTVRASVDRGFQRSFRTILIADGVSLLSAFVLFFLAEGNVKGFAFFLGLSTVLDLLVSFFIMHPLVSILGHKPAIVRAKIIGIGAGLDVPEVEA